jgi:hypothetical protein
MSSHPRMTRTILAPGRIRRSLHAAWRTAARRCVACARSVWNLVWQTRRKSQTACLALPCLALPCLAKPTPCQALPTPALPCPALSRTWFGKRAERARHVSSHMLSAMTSTTQTSTTVLTQRPWLVLSGLLAGAATAADVRGGLPGGDRLRHLREPGATTVVLSHLYIKTITLPRRARDKHRESTQKRLLFCAPVLLTHELPRVHDGVRATSSSFFLLSDHFMFALLPFFNFWNCSRRFCSLIPGTFRCALAFSAGCWGRLPVAARRSAASSASVRKQRRFLEPVSHQNDQVVAKTGSGRTLGGRVKKKDVSCRHRH